MFEKAIKIKSLYDEMGEENAVVGLMNTVDDTLQFHVFRAYKFVEISKSNEKKYSVEYNSESKFSYKFTTGVEGVEFIYLANEKERHFIIDQLL